MYVAFKLNPLKRGDKIVYMYNAKFNDFRQLDTAQYEFEQVAIVGDANTQRMIGTNAGQATINNTILRPYMNFVIAPVGWVINKTTGKKSYASLEHGFYRNESVKIDGNYYLFDRNGELVETLGLTSIRRGNRDYIYEVTPSGPYSCALKLGFDKNIVPGLTIEDQEYWKVLTENNLISSAHNSFTEFCNSHQGKNQLNQELVYEFLFKNSNKQEIVNSIYTNIRQISKICNAFFTSPAISPLEQALQCQGDLPLSELARSYLNKSYIKVNVDETSGIMFGFIEDNDLKARVLHDVLQEEYAEFEQKLQNFEAKVDLVGCEASIESSILYFKPELAEGWVKDRNDWYYFRHSNMLIGEQEITLQEGVNPAKPNGYYYFDVEGRMKTNYFFQGPYWNRYHGADGIAVKSQYVTINGESYWFDANGKGGISNPERATRYKKQGKNKIFAYNNNSVVNVFTITDLSDGWRKAYMTPYQGYNTFDVGYDSVVLNIENNLPEEGDSVRSNTIRTTYRDAGYDKQIQPNKSDIFWNFKFTKSEGKKYQSYRYDNPMVMSWPIGNNSDQCFITIYTWREKLSQFETVNMDVYSGRGISIPGKNTVSWQKLYEIPAVKQNGNKTNSTTPLVDLRVHKTGNIYQLDISSTDANKPEPEFKQLDIDIPICSTGG